MRRGTYPTRDARFCAASVWRQATAGRVSYGRSGCARQAGSARLAGTRLRSPCLDLIMDATYGLRRLSGGFNARRAEPGYRYPSCCCEAQHHLGALLYVSEAAGRTRRATAAKEAGRRAGATEHNGCLLCVCEEQPKQC
jgi:hypothetical protein